MTNYPLIAVAGPTGSGKSALGLYLARQFDGEILNCDSVQVYSGFDIGSAKTPLESRCGIPHHLIDIAVAGEELTAGAYARLGRTVLNGMAERGKIPIVVGGTGLYLRALLDGLSPAPQRSELLRARLRDVQSKTPAALHRFVRRFDPETAARIHSRDHQKLIRTIELIISAGQPASALRAVPRNGLNGMKVLKIGLLPERNELYRRLNERAAEIFREGLIEETAGLLRSGVAPAAKPMQSLGYKQAVEQILGTLTREQAVEQCQTKTRQYAKRQLTWFRRESGLVWLHGFGSDLPVQEKARELCRGLLSAS